MSKILLGVNIDHIATLRNARGTCFPEPAHLAAVAECAGADGITIHLREDRRHINDRDLALLGADLHHHNPVWQTSSDRTRPATQSQSLAQGVVVVQHP